MKLKSKFKILILLCAMCISLTAAVAVIASPQTASANAADTVFDISGAGGAGFNSENLKTLMGKIMGKEKASYNELKAHLDINATKSGSQINTAVKLGGQTWNVVYASETNGGDVIATLWLAESEDLQQFSNWQYAESCTWEYPSSMYGTSFLRSYIVGSTYSKSEKGGPITENDVTLTAGKQAAIWHDFVETYDDFIITPSEVAWQETEGFEANGVSLPNEAYGTPSTPNWYRAEMDFSSKVGYRDWQYDKLWIPSRAEAKFDSGIWGVTQAICANSETTWLRSSYGDFASGACRLEPDGTHGHYSAISFYAVRPAFHLNLKTAAAAAGLTVETPYFNNSTGVTLSNNNTVASATYSNNLTFNLSVPAGVSVYVGAAEVAGSSFTVKSAGTHVVTMTPKAGYGWADGSLGAKTLTVVVEKAAFDMSAVKWCETTQFTEDGTLHSVYLTGLPEGVTAIYQNNSASVAGSYEATANFLYDTVNYSAPNLKNTSCAWAVKPATPVDPTDPTTPVDPTPPTDTTPVVVYEGLSGGAIAAIVICCALAGVATVAAIGALIAKNRSKVIIDGGFYDDAAGEE